MATAYFRHLMNALKIVLVGDAEVGKTWLVSRAKELYATLHDHYSLMKEPFDYDLVYSPTVFETCFSNIDTKQLGNHQTNIWDTGWLCYPRLAEALVVHSCRCLYVVLWYIQSWIVLRRQRKVATRTSKIWTWYAGSYCWYEGWSSRPNCKVSNFSRKQPDYRRPALSWARFVILQSFLNAWGTLTENYIII